MKNLVKKSNKSDKGITLIALVVTIIVLLILAGIAISMLSGDNSILQKAGEAKIKTDIGGLAEEVRIVVTGKEIDNIVNIGNNKELKDELEEINGATVEEIDGYTDVYYVKKGENYVTVYSDGEVQDGKTEVIQF